MRILHVVGGLSWVFGGVTASVLQMTEALCGQSEVEVEIATTDADGAGGHLAPPQRVQTPVPVHYFRHSASERLKVSWPLRRWLNAHAHEYDLLHIHGIWSFATTAGARAARGTGRPYVITTHGMLAPYSFGRSRGVKRVWWQIFERTNLRRASRLHFSTETEREAARPLGLATPTAVIPMGVEAVAWETRADASRWPEWLSRLKQRGPVVFFLSRLHPVKGVHDLLLPAFSQLAPPAQLVIVGGPDGHEPGYPDRIRAEVTRLGLADRVTMPGPAPAADRFHWLDAADLFVLPSHHESFGVVVLEALARGVPVVISDQVQCWHHIERADCGLVVPLRVERVTGAMRELLADGPRRAAMGARGRDYVRAHLGWTTVAEQLANLYKECIEAARTPLRENKPR